MSTVSLADVRRKLLDALTLRGLSNDEASIIADDLLDAEMSNVKTHGIAKIAVIDGAIKARLGPPRVITDTQVYALVDGQRELGQIAANYCIDLLTRKASVQGLAVVGLVNASRFGRLTPYGRKLAQSGLVGILMNSGGPSAVPPYGSYAPIFGTNPICFAFPNSTGDLVIDFSTAQAVWGEIRRAVLEGRQLPHETFFKSDGTFAVNPQDANAVKAFGGAKGYALCLAVEILCGALLGAKMGLAVDNEYDLGFLFIALSPTLFRNSIDEFKGEIDTLMADIKKAPPLSQGIHVRLPGEHSARLRSQHERTQLIDVHDGIWELLCNMAVDRDASLENSNLTN